MWGRDLAGILAGLAVFVLSGAAFGQGALLPFAGLEPGSNTEVEIAADSLGIDRDTGQAKFTGNVIVGIEGMRLSADSLVVVYSSTAEGGVSKLLATGSVVFSNGDEAAEGDVADVDLEAGLVVFTGNVILTQGRNAIAGDRLVIDLNAGTANMEGRVRSVLQTEDFQ